MNLIKHCIKKNYYLMFNIQKKLENLKMKEIEIINDMMFN